MTKRSRQYLAQSHEQIRANVEIKKNAAKASTITKACRYTAYVAGVGIVAHYTFKAIEVLAGKTTTADIIFRLLSDIRIEVILPLGFGIAGVAYGARQRHLRKKNIKRMSRRIAELEKQINPDRKSSELTETGETNAEED